MTADHGKEIKFDPAWEAVKVPEEYGVNYSHNIFVIKLTAGTSIFYGYIHEKTDIVTVPLESANGRFGRVKMVQHNKMALGEKGFGQDRNEALAALGLKKLTIYGHVSNHICYSGYYVDRKEETGFHLITTLFKQATPQKMAERLEEELNFQLEPVTIQELENLR